MPARRAELGVPLPGPRSALRPGRAPGRGPDLVGFGRSDKPASRADHTCARHVAWQRRVLFDELDLTGVTLVCQDWGGPIGLRLVTEHPERFRRVVVANTGLPTGGPAHGRRFFVWQRYSQEVPEMPLSRIVRRGTVNWLPDDVAAAYDAPFPGERFKEGPRQMPALVPTGSLTTGWLTTGLGPAHGQAARSTWRRPCQGTTLNAWSSAPPRPHPTVVNEPVERCILQATVSAAPSAQATAALMGDTWLTTTTSPCRAAPAGANSSSQALRTRAPTSSSDSPPAGR